jgi:hypothetical protein
VDENPSTLMMDLLRVSYSIDGAFMVLEFIRTRVGATEFNFLRKGMKNVTFTIVW